MRNSQNKKGHRSDLLLSLGMLLLLGNLALCRFGFVNSREFL